LGTALKIEYYARNLAFLEEKGEVFVELSLIGIC